MSIVKLVSKQVVYAAPDKGMSAYENTYYTRAAGVEKVRMRLLDISDDVPGPREVAFSQDNGRTWPEVIQVPQPREVEGGTLREWPCELWVDPVNGRQLNFSLECVFPTNSSSHGARNYYLKYQVSEDGGRTKIVNERVIEEGYTAENPMVGMWIGKNAFTNAAMPGMIRMPDGKILAVMSKTVHGPDGELYNPANSWMWTEIQVLHGFWLEGGKIEWHAGPVIRLTPAQATRGICEPALTLLSDGTVMTVMRACNGGRADPQSKLPCHKWVSYSKDGGGTWTYPKPWGYDTGEAFFSPDSISGFLRHSNGKLYWAGNICATNPVHGSGREKLYIGEVDQKTGRLIKETVSILAEPEVGGPPTMLSNFMFHEDRETKQLVLNLPWFVEQEKDKWGADTWVFRYELKGN